MVAPVVSGVLVGAVLAWLTQYRKRGDELEALRASNARQESAQTLQTAKLDEIRRRLIALERKTHGFDLDGIPVITGERD